MGQGGSSACCGRERERRGEEGDDIEVRMPLRRITALQDTRVHFINDAPMFCMWEEGIGRGKEPRMVKDINGVSLFLVVGGDAGKLMLPGGLDHAVSACLYSFSLLKPSSVAYPEAFSLRRRVVSSRVRPSSRTSCEEGRERKN